MKHIIKADEIEKAIKGGASDAEIAAILGVKIGAVRSQLTRMRKQLGESKIPLRKGPRKPKPDRKEADPKDALRLAALWFDGESNARQWADRVCAVRRQSKSFLSTLHAIFICEYVVSKASFRGVQIPCTRYVVAVLRRAFPELPWQRSKQAREAAKATGA